MKRILICCSSLLLIFSGCRSKGEQMQLPGAELQHFCNQTLTDVIVYDIITPPVASRMYAYSNLAYYEALRHPADTFPSFLQQLKGFDVSAEMRPPAAINHRLAAALSARC